MNSKSCEICHVDMVKKPKETHVAWAKRRFCSHRCNGRSMKPVINDEARFWSMVDKTENCWLWQGALRRGYGQYRLWGRSWGVHQIAYKLLRGEIPETMTIDHLCRVKNCVNPEHMELVTGGENTRRANATRTHCKRGHEFTPENTVQLPLGRGCRTCRLETSRRWNARHRQLNTI